jgi:hypothetical protein
LAIAYCLLLIAYWLLCHFYRRHAGFNLSCWVAGYHGIGRHAFGHHRTAANGNMIANGYIADNAGIATHIYVIADYRRSCQGTILP